MAVVGNGFRSQKSIDTSTCGNGFQEKIWFHSSDVSAAATVAPSNALPHQQQIFSSNILVLPRPLCFFARGWDPQISRIIRFKRVFRFESHPPTRLTEKMTSRITKMGFGPFRFETVFRFEPHPPTRLTEKMTSRIRSRKHAPLSPDTLFTMQT